MTLHPENCDSNDVNLYLHSGVDEFVHFAFNLMQDASAKTAPE